MNDSSVFLLLKVLSAVWEAFVLTQLWPLRALSSRVVHVCLAGLFISHFAGDIINIVTGEFAHPKVFETLPAVAAKFILRFVHVAFSFLVLQQLSLNRRRALLSPQIALGLVTIAPFMTRFAISISKSGLEHSPVVVANELFLFSVLSISFPLGVLVLSAASNIEWCCLAGGILVAVLGAVGKRYEAWAGMPGDSYYYEIFWTLGLFLQGYGALKISRGTSSLDVNTGASTLKMSKTALLTGTSLAVLAVMNLQSPAARSIEHATFIGAFGVCSSLILTVFYNRTQGAVIRAVQKLLEDSSGQTNKVENGVELATEFQGAIHLVLEKRDELLRWKMEEEHRAALEREVVGAKAKVYERIMHDIRSPLAALSVATGDLSGLCEDRRILIQAATDRIRDMAEELLTRGRTSKTAEGGEGSDVTEENIARHLEAALSEKRLELRNRPNLELTFHIDRNIRFLFASINRTQFRSVISNLINNAAEAMGHRGVVRIALEVVGKPRREMCRVVVADNGPGIPPEVCARLGRERVTSGKANGNGIGLFAAANTIESWGGQLEISSVPQRGTEVVITLPKVAPPNWMVDSISIESHTRVLVVDDDDSIHRVWDVLFHKAGAERHDVEIIHYRSAKKFEQEIAQVRRNGSPFLCLVDYEIARDNGLALIERNCVAARSVLVTSHDDNSAVRKQCQDLGTRLLPKSMAPYVDIQIKAQTSENVPDGCFSLATSLST